MDVRRDCCCFKGLYPICGEVHIPILSISFIKCSFIDFQQKLKVRSHAADVGAVFEDVGLKHLSKFMQEVQERPDY